MASCYQEVDYCSEEVKSVVSPAGFGRHHGGHGAGVQQHVVKEKFEEVDGVSRAGFGRRHGGAGGQFEVRESKFEEDINTRTGEFQERKENFVVKAAN